jgi:hypothetical protein
LLNSINYANYILFIFFFNVYFVNYFIHSIIFVSINFLGISKDFYNFVFFGNSIFYGVYIIEFANYFGIFAK